MQSKERDPNDNGGYVIGLKLEDDEGQLTPLFEFHGSKAGIVIPHPEKVALIDRVCQ